MIILQSGRQMGKTGVLITDAHETGAGILTFDKRMADCIKNQAKEMGMPDVKVFTYNDLETDKILHSNITKLNIDELDMFLRRVLRVTEIGIASCDASCLPIMEVYKQGGLIRRNDEFDARIDGLAALKRIDKPVFKDYQPTPLEALLNHLGIEIREVFKINNMKFHFDKCGLLRDEKGITNFRVLKRIMCGEYEITKLPWIPEDGEEVYGIETEGEIYSYHFNKGSEADLSMAKNNWFFKTEESAERAKERVLAEYRELLG